MNWFNFLNGAFLLIVGCLGTHKVAIGESNWIMITIFSTLVVWTLIDLAMSPVEKKEVK